MVENKMFLISDCDFRFTIRQNKLIFLIKIRVQVKFLFHYSSVAFVTVVLSVVLLDTVPFLFL